MVKIDPYILSYITFDFEQRVLLCITTSSVASMESLKSDSETFWLATTGTLDSSSLIKGMWREIFLVKMFCYFN